MMNKNTVIILLSNSDVWSVFSEVVKSKNGLRFHRVCRSAQQAVNING